MTYLQNTQADIQSFLDITSTQIRIVASNETENRIENPSFETPIYKGDTQGTFSQYNWRYTTSADVDTFPRPVTYHHAYSGSFAWKVRMTTNQQIISYGQEKAIQPTPQREYQDILSFYCYCVEDASTDSYSRTEYAAIIPSKTHTFSLKIYGIDKLSYVTENPSKTLVAEHLFTLESLPKSDAGDLDIGLSGSKIPHFYKWNRIVFHIPESVKSHKYFYFTINKVANNAAGFDTYFVIDAVQLEKQPLNKTATMYFDGSYESFNNRKYPYDFQWTGEPYNSTSIRSKDTRVNGELIDINDYCNFNLVSIGGLTTPSQETAMFSKTFQDGQYFVDQIIRNQPITITGRIITSSEEMFMESFARFQELIGKRPFAAPEPVRMVLTLSFNNGLKLLPVYLDVVYQSGLEQETANVFQSDVEITFDVISTHLQYQNDSAANMFNDSPLFDQFNTMNVDVLRDVGGLLYYNKSEEKWEVPGGISIFKLIDSSYLSQLSYNGSGINQRYAVKSNYTVGDVNVIKEDSEGIIWLGGDFDVVEFDAYYVDSSDERVNVKLQCRVNNIVGIRKRIMSGKAYVLPEINSSTISRRENGPNLTEVEFVSDWQIIVLLDAPSRYSQSEEQNPLPFIGIPGQSNVVINAIEFTPDGSMYIGGKFSITYGGRRCVNFIKFTPYGSDAANVTLYDPEDAYGWVSTNLTPTQLLSNTNRGLHRTYWVNSATPYAKYGVFEDVGRVGGEPGDTISQVNDIVYDIFNECLYLGGTFVKVANRNTPYDLFYAPRIVKYFITSYSFIPMNNGVTGAGIQMDSLTESSDVFVKKILVQYLPTGVRIFALGRFTKAGLLSGQLNTFGIAIITSRIDTPNDFTYVDTGGGGFKASTPNDSATFYDAIITSDDRVFVAGDFNRVNRNITPYVSITGIAEYRYGNFVDITRGLDADYYDDTYENIPAVRSLASNSFGEIYFAGNFTNIKNQQIVDGIAKWNGKEFTGTGLYFIPKLPKILQKVFVDKGDNVFVFTGPNVEKTTVVNSLLCNLNYYALPTNIDTVWTQYPYSILKSVFKDTDLSIEFYSYQVVGGKTVRVSGQVNAVCRVGPTGSPGMRWYATQETVFIAGKFDYIKIGDTEFRVNNIVALRYDENLNPFPYRVLAISHGVTPYYDSGSFGEDLPHIGIDLRDRNGVTNSQIFSIDVEVRQFGANYVPLYVHVGGRFDNVSRGRYLKNFMFITLQLNGSNSDLVFNLPENFEQNISVPFINYASYNAPGAAGTPGVNDAVFVVRATSGTFTGGVTRTNPSVVFLGGSFTQLISSGRVLPARRIGVFVSNNTYTGGSVSLSKLHQYYKIDFTDETVTPKGAQINTAFSEQVYVKTLEYTPWRTVVTNTFDTTLIVGGQFNNSTSPFAAGGGTSVTSGLDLVKLGIVNAAKNEPQVEYNMPAFNSLLYIQDSAFDDNLTVVMSGKFSTLSSPTQENIVALVGSTSADSVTFNRVASNDWTNIYQSSTGLPFVPEYVTRDVSTNSYLFTGQVEVTNSTVSALFPDYLAIKYGSESVLYSANYAYGTANVPQVSATVLGNTIDISPPSRRLMQVSTSQAGRAIDLRRSAGTDYSFSIPIENYTNTMYDVAVMQTFNCYNNGTASVYPTITLHTPYKQNSMVQPFIHVITNVTTKQSMYLNIWLQANEYIRIRTERDRISVISNIRGNITNGILGVKNVSLSQIDDAQIFRLIPGKNVIRYGPMMPLQRYFLTGFNLSNVGYNTNRNVVVPPLVISMSWPIAFNSIYDALYSEVNPLLL